MKKTITLVSLVCLFVFLVGMSFAEISPTQLIMNKNKSFNGSMSINIGEKYYISDSYGWVKFTATETGVHFLYSEQIKGRLKVYLTDQYEQYITDFTSAVIPVNLEAGDDYYIRVRGLELSSFSGKAFLGVCSPSQHIQLGSEQIKTSPTCTENGQAVKKCAVCNSEVNTKELPLIGHIPGEKETLEASTCMEQGIQVVRCVKCNEVLSTEALALSGHTPGDMQPVIAATCSTSGRGEQRCTVCNLLICNESIPANGHKPDIWKDEMKPTCTAAGIRRQYCAECNALLTEESVPAYGHSITDWIRVREASCTQYGLNEKKCAVCGVVLESERLNALGHSYTEWEVISEATKEREGEQRRHCIHCGDTQFEKIPKIKTLFDYFRGE